MYLGFDSYVIWVDVVAVLTGAFLPFFLRGNFKKSIINFPHLVERFELLTIITFGEAIVGITHFFDVHNFELLPILTFLIVISMYGSYVIQIHNLMEHHRVERSLRLMFSHYFIVISINLLTVSLEWIHGGVVDNYYSAVLMIMSLVMFFVFIIVNKEYYMERVEFTKMDAVVMLIVTIAGIAVILGVSSTVYGILVGALVITLGNFGVLLNKNQKMSKSLEG